MAKKTGHLRLTPPWLQTDDYRHGPIYVLDPEAWMDGRRVVIEVIQPAGAAPPKPAKNPVPVPVTGETKRVVRWPAGRPLEWEIAEIPVRRSELAWAPRARELRATGWSIRRIMAELKVGSRRQLCELLDK